MWKQGVYTAFFVGLAITTASAQGAITKILESHCADDQEDRLTVELRDRIATDLDRLAQELSTFVVQSNVRDVLTKRVASAKKRTVGLGQLFGELRSRDPDRPDERLDSLDEAVRKIESVMIECGLDSPRLNLKLPVDAHVESLGSGELNVAIAPLADEKKTEEIVAYAKGEPLRLDPATPPKVATLVLVGDEPQSVDPGYPIDSADQPGEETNPRVVDDYVGIPWIYMYDDHESWVCGDPEVYVRVKRFRFSTFSIINEKFDLPGVDGEKVWYNLGDWNSTYRYVSTSDYAPVVRLEFWEEDSGFHGGDDYMGAINIWWTGLSFSGYQYYTAGDIRFGIDRD